MEYDSKVHAAINLDAFIVVGLKLMVLVRVTRKIVGMNYVHLNYVLVLNY